MLSFELFSKKYLHSSGGFTVFNLVIRILLLTNFILQKMTDFGSTKAVLSAPALYGMNLRKQV